MPWYGTGRSTFRGAQQLEAQYNLKLLYKRDFMDDTHLFGTFSSVYRKSGRVAQVTNSTGALVDFILILEAQEWRWSPPRGSRSKNLFH